ncbi:MAG: efflux RND transporter periplasmic adaptor subunit [Blastocatellia bacterium]
MKHLSRIAMLIAAVAAIGSAVFVAWRPAPVSVETAAVTCGPMRVTIDAEGKTRVRKRYVAAAPVTGRLTRIALERGARVTQGATLARLEPLPLPPLDPRQLAEARARVAAAEQLRNEAETGVTHVAADCEQAARELTRATSLVETGDIARQEYERIRNAAQTCRQQHEAAQYRARAAAADVDLARAALLAVERAGQSGDSAVITVRAPVAGRVLRILEESERVVPAGTPLLELSGAALEIVMDVLSTDAVRIRPGARVWVEGWGGDRALPARVRLIEPSGFTKISALGIEEQRVNVIADFTEQNASLADGYRVEARIVMWEAAEVLKVPLSALFRRGDAWHVFVLEQGIARLRPVETGQRTQLEAEVQRGLRRDEQVIAHPAAEVTDGVRVAAR